MSASGLLYAYYGDDFTGSTDVLEALALYGVESVLFTHPPEEQQLRAFSHCRAIGIAGESRSRSPQWMTENLPEIFARMKAMGAPVNQYKVCSTFDSAPQVGSIGRAMELGARAFDAEFVPVVVGAPQLGRAVVFANLFAAADGVFHRIDRHPTMSRHPATPMNEADLRVHLARQTAMKMGIVDLRAFQAGRAEEQLATELAGGAQAVIFDGCDAAMLDETARMLSNRPAARSVFAVGSSGLTYGFLRHWQGAGAIESAQRTPQAVAVDRLLVVSGSCSPVTAAQIHHAIQDGFAAIHLGGRPKGRESWDAAKRSALEALARGQSAVLYTALGSQALDQQHGDELGVALGELLRELLLGSGVRRAVVAGGDTATHAIKQLGLTALTFVASLTPGAPLCRAYAPGSPLDGLELVLKGGQIGAENFFAQARHGA